MLTLTDPSNQTGAFFQLQLVFMDPLPPFRGRLLPSRQAHCYLPLAAFEDSYHVVQTEKPVYAHGWWEDTDNSVFDAAVSTGSEPPGEGLAEPVLRMIQWWGNP